MAHPARRSTDFARGIAAVLPALGLLATAPAGHAADDWDVPPDPRTAHEAIAGPALTFLPEPPAEPVHHHHTLAIIDARSLEDGWVRLEQCHEHLDAFPSAAVVYRGSRIRGLEIVSVEGIDAAWVEDARIELRGIRPGARLCMKAESRALTDNGDGTWTLRNGPFMRQLMDGYFPMHVTMDVRLPPGLGLLSAHPRPRPGLAIRTRPGRIELDAWFEGRLVTALILGPAGDGR